MDKTALYGVGFLVGFGALVISFLRDLRRKRRGEPIRDSLGGEVYPDDPRYNWMWSIAMKPYYIFFGIIGLLFAVFLWVVAKWFFGL
jgi:hypothetical protein